MIVILTITTFFSQLVFIGTRTWNVKAVARHDMKQALISGTVVNLSWLISTALGAVSTHEIITKGDWQYWPLVAASVLGGLAGTWIAMTGYWIKIAEKFLKSKQ